tara:strand:- start:3810 stop:4259 length:450 start_codon:yes stop_codon:yes gene_type:complete
MKITKNQLRRIIREVRAGWTKADEDAADYNAGYNDAEDGKESDPDLERNTEYSRGYMAGLTGSPDRRVRGGYQGIKEAEGSTSEYDDDSALTGDQSKLPDGLQKSIIDKTVEDREENEGEDRKEKNEGTEIGNMPDSWRQILGDCLGDK